MRENNCSVAYRVLKAEVSFKNRRKMGKIGGLVLIDLQLMGRNHSCACLHLELPLVSAPKVISPTSPEPLWFEKLLS